MRTGELFPELSRFAAVFVPESADTAAKWVVAVKPNRVAAATARMGYSLILTSGGMDGDRETVLGNYRARDMVEKLFDALKNEDGRRRLRTGHDDSAQGRFFLAFLTLILRAELEWKMNAAKLHKTWTEAGLIDQMGKVKAVITRSGKRILLEVSKTQRTILTALKLAPIT